MDLDYHTYLALYKKILTPEEEQALADYCDILSERYDNDGQTKKSTGPVYFDDDDEVTKFICDFNGCSRSYRLSESLARHRVTHLKPRQEFACKWKNCDKVYKHKTGLDNHARAVHLNVTIACRVQQCGRVFATQNVMTRHMRRDHPDINLEIETQEALDPTDTETTVPQESVEDKSEQKSKPGTPSKESPGMNGRVTRLSVSPKKTSSPAVPTEVALDLTGKKLSKSPKKAEPKSKSDDKVFVCRWPNCHKVFSCLRYVVQHKKRQHLKTLQKPSLVRKRVELKARKLFSCEAPGCDLKFLLSSQLLKHLLQTHSNIEVKTYKCDECTKIFATKQGLKRHQKKHQVVSS